ncbi:MAG: hypothetical protein NC908_04435 [Candidatus Omnitrophica bacterium]|nr:hypothetical protein [Candidatus Omnitrophota bacterium]
MEETLKDRLILILGILTVIFFIGMVGSCSNLNRYKTQRDKEIANRLDLEEKLTQDKQLLEKRLSSLTQELEEEKAAHQATKKALLQEQLVNQSLKEELQKVSELKNALEEDLKEALIKNKTEAVQPSTKK